MDLQNAARELTILQPCLTYYEALELLLAAYKRFLPSKHHGSVLKTCLNIEYNILQRASEAELRARLSTASLDR